MIEDIVLENSSRNIDFLRQFMPKQYILRAAELIHKLKGEKGKALVGITCGFYVNGRAETDGPPGAFFLYNALEMLGFCPYIVTDDYCRGFFEGLSCLFYPDISLNFDLLISVERAGRSKDGRYYNMKKKDITDHTPPIDELFINAKAPTIGIGDGGNEIGMGNFY
ncbi:MAG: DUF4392 domain-containing protein, partial [Clostridiaceae bacterium]|nr:DUF4392 domain-containing protein [Clostridiaceae bacterium]